MLKNKGFTLIELTGVMVVISLILIFTLPQIIQNMKDAKERDYNRFVEDLKMAAETYVENNRDNYPELGIVGSRIFVSIDDLVAVGLIRKEIINPKTGIVIDNQYTVAVTKNIDGTLEYEYKEANAKLEGYVSDGLKILYDGYNSLFESGSELKWPDMSGNNNNGTVINSSGLSIQNNGYIKLDGVNDYILANNSLSMVGTDGSYSIQIVYNAYVPDTENIYMRSRGLGLYYMDIYADGILRSMISTDVANTTNSWPYSSTDYVRNLNKKYTLTVAATASGQNINVQYYVDNNKLPMTFPTGVKHPQALFDYMVGVDHSGITSYIKVYSFRMYNRALTDDEVNNNYKIDNARYE